MNPYISDILSQPAAFAPRLDNYSKAALDKIDLAEFDRIIISGMGSSFNAAYPALIELSKAIRSGSTGQRGGTSSFSNWDDRTRSLLWLNSQSGRSAELVHLLEQHPICAAGLFADIRQRCLRARWGSELIVCVPIHAGEEATVSTKTYTNMLAVNLLAAIQLSGGDLDGAIREMRAAADAMELYLQIGKCACRNWIPCWVISSNSILIGRGSSMSAVWNGSLNNKEAAKCSFEGMHAADFRHGPLEVVEPGFTALILAGTSSSAGMNRDLARDILSHAGKVIWAGFLHRCGIPNTTDT